jgi:bifunctional non-homologous end joining protein LigD
MSKNIRTYRSKRDFAKTPEPRPQKRHRKTREPVFVIHLHEARRAHYDLRLEVDGVLKSFAVPKGFSFDPKTKYLAIRTEDHPLEYEHFDGVIPAGQYGAGMMTIWDRGRFELLNGSWEEAIDEGKIELRLRGARLRGEWHMVKLKKEKDQWLMFKARDHYARQNGEPAVALNLLAVSASAMPQRLGRMEAGREVTPFVDADWVYEPLLPGLRVFAEKQGETVRFRGTRRNLDKITARVIADLQRVKAENAIIDGLFVGLDARSLPCRATLESVLTGQSDAPIHYYAFDLLYYDEWALRKFPLAERKAALAAILPASSHVVYVDHERSRASELMETAAAIGLPGTIAKRAASFYRRGPSEDWLTIEPNQEQVIRKQAKSKPVARSRKLTFTNQRRVLWPRMGYTKGDLIDYYGHVADWLLPYLKDRPLSLNRFPSGIDHESFFQKNTPDHAPEWIETVLVDSKHRDEVTNRFVLCNERDTLLYLANLAAVELHPWSSRRGSLESPDWAIFDLDPTQDDFRDVVELAQELGELLRDVGLRPYLKTSGASGMHVYVPVVLQYSYDHVRMFCESVARVIAIRRPDIATIERSKPRRDGKIYIDFLQNRRGQTIVAPFVVRPVPEASVSMPLDWDELSVDLHPSQFTIQNAVSRAKTLGDPFREVLTDRQDIMPAIDALRALFG